MFSRQSNLFTFYLRLYASLTSLCNLPVPFFLLFALFALNRDAAFDRHDSAALRQFTGHNMLLEFMYRSVKAAMLLNLS